MFNFWTPRICSIPFLFNVYYFVFFGIIQELFSCTNLGEVLIARLTEQCGHRFFKKMKSYSCISFQKHSKDESFVQLKICLLRMGAKREKSGVENIPVSCAVNRNSVVQDVKQFAINPYSSSCRLEPFYVHFKKKEITICNQSILKKHVNLYILMFILRRNYTNQIMKTLFTCTISKAFLISNKLLLIISIRLIYSPTDNLTE